MHLAIYAHPFDLEALRAHGGLARLRDLGFAEVAMATSYHDGRWLQPWHPAGRVRFLEDGTVHFRPGADYGILQPKISSDVPVNGPSPLERLCAEAPPLGLAARAWNVFTHNSRLGAMHPDLCVQNAFGDRYTYALCPAQPAVQQYFVAMTRDLEAHAGLGSIEFEAAGQMGHKHSSHHDKASFTPTGLLDAALSACFCGACDRAMRVVGCDPVQVSAAIRSFVDHHVTQADAMAPDAVPANPADANARVEWLESVLAARHATVRHLATAAGTVVQKHRAIQIHPHPWFTGSQLAASTAALFPVQDERVLTCYGEGVDAIARGLGALPLAQRAVPLRVSIWPKAPQFRSDDDLRALRDLLVAQNVGALAIYHLGLLPWRTIERVAKIFRA